MLRRIGRPLPLTYLISLLKKNSKISPTVEDPDKKVKTRSEQIKDIREKLLKLEEEEPGLRLTDDAIASLLTRDISVLRKIQNEIASIVTEELSKPVRSGDLSTVRYEVERKLRLSEAIPPAELQTLITLGRSLVVETETINKELTDKRIEEEKNAVEPTRILQGQVIVREGQFIDSEIYRQLELTGLLTNQSSTKPMAGLILYVVFCVSHHSICIFLRGRKTIIRKRNHC